MAENADGCKNHACEVAVCVADENACRVSVMSEEGKGDTEEREKEVEGEQMRVCCWMWVGQA